ncbi:MAG: hypothetical protein ACLTYN_10955 [Dysosmobacter welbionis]
MVRFKENRLTAGRCRAEPGSTGGILRPEQPESLLAGFTAPADGSVASAQPMGADGARYGPIRRKRRRPAASLSGTGPRPQRTAPLTLGRTVCAWPAVRRAGVRRAGEKGFTRDDSGQ